MNRILRTLGALSLGWAIGSCGDSPTGPPPPPPPVTDLVVLSTSTATVVPAATTQLSATAKDQSGQPLQRVFSWTTSDAAKATVSSSGLVSGVAPGNVNITAAVDGKSATATVTVLDGGVVASAGSTLNLASGAVQIVVPADALTTATGLFIIPSTAFVSDPRVVKGTPFDFGPSGTHFATPATIKIHYDPANLPAGTEEAALRLHLSVASAWQAITTSTVDTAANIVSAQVEHFSTYAILTPAAIAAVGIRGPPEKPPIANNSVSITVGESEQLTTVLTDAEGQILSDRLVTWKTSDPAIATVSSAGLLAAIAPGPATITASAGGVSSSLSVTVMPVPVAAIAVTLAPPAVMVGQTSQANVAVTDAAGNVLTGRVVAWTSDNTAVATVSPSGEVTALSPGTAQIIATSEGKSGSAPVTVTAVPVASVTVTPASASIVVGANHQLAAETKDAAGNVLADRAVTWTSSDAAVATVSTSGLVTAATVGTATITAASEGKTGSATVTITPVPVASVSLSAATTSQVLGATQLVTASPKDVAGNVLVGRVVSWESSNPAVLALSAPSSTSTSTGASVTVTAAGLGTAIITASSESAPSVSTPLISVSPVPVATVTVDPTSATLVLGIAATQQLAAAIKDADGKVLSGRTVTWTSSAPAAATVDANGFVTAVAPGTTTITATSEGKTGTASITVASAPVATVTVSLDPASITAAGTSRASATTLDAKGAVLTGRTVVWSSSNTAVATVDPSTGVISPVSLGTANIIATSEGKSGSATVTVTQIPVATVTVSVASTSISANQTTQATATLRDANGNILTGRTIDWSTDAPDVATVSASGLVSGVSPGVATIAAESEGKLATATVTITPVPVASVTVLLQSASVVAGQTTQATAATLDAGGNQLTGRSITWTSSNANVATVSATGLVTSVAAGTTRIVATSETKSGEATLTVTPVPVASVSVSPPSATVIAGATEQLAATAKDANGASLPGRPITWSSTDNAIASVDQNGLVTAHAVGSVTINATSEGKAGASSITVVPVPVASVTVSLSQSSITAVGTAQATAATLDASGGVLTGRPVSWSSSNTAVATVNASTGVVTAVSTGTANIIATSEGKTGQAPLTVTQAPVATVMIDPPAATVFQSETEQLSVVLKDANQNVLTRAVTWSSSNPGVATVSATGLVTAATATMGTTTITATSEGKTGTSLITVSQVPVASISVALTASSINVGQNTLASATLRDASGDVLAGRTLAWSSDNSAVATVSSSGVVTAVAVGTAHISATSGGQTGTATLTVTPIPVASVSVSLAASPIQVGQSTQASATIRDASNNPLTGRAVVWSSDNTAVATVSTTGLVSGIAAGTANIIASSEGTIGSAQLTVIPVPVSSLALTSVITPVILGQTQQLTAIPKDASGATLVGRTVNWVSSNPAVLSVSSPSSVSTSSGATISLTAAGVGTAIITATSESAPGASTPVITVNPIPVATVVVTPSPVSLALGVTSTQQLTATLKDASNNVLTGRTVSWSSSVPSVATVDGNGFVTALAGGTTTVTATSEGKAGTASIVVTVPVIRVAVDPPSVTLTVGLTHQLTATLTDINGAVLTARAVSWSSSDPTRATVSSSGLVTALAAGPAVITATSEGKSGSSSITVTQIPVASVGVSLSASNIQVGQTTQATATTFDANNIVITGRAVTWSSANSAVASVSSSGIVTANGVGSTTIIATSEGKSGSAPITVVPVPVGSVTVSPPAATLISGATQQLSAETKDANGRIVTDRLVTWSSNNTAVATVSASGLITAQSVGNATVTATSEGKSGASSITVVPIPVASVTVTLTPNSVTAVGTSQATATMRDATGGVLTGRELGWSSSNPAVATVSAQGVVTAVSVGTATITATSEGKSGGATLTVTPAPVASVTVIPPGATIVQGGTEQLDVVLKDANGTVLTRPVTWSSSSDAVASVSPAGLVTGNSPGTATITATSEGKSGVTSVTVSPVPVASIDVTLSVATITDAETSQATAVVKDADNNVLIGRTIAWSSSNTSVATVSTTGLVTPVAPGSAQIRASSGGQTGFASITVIPKVAAVVVSPPSANVVISSTLQLSAQTRDANNNVLTGRTVTWSSSAPSIASVSASGLLTAVGLGGATITATSEGVVGTSSVTVVPIPVAIVTVSLGSTSVIVGQTTQATATTRDASGTVLTGRTVSWSSGNPAKATVSATGLVTAIDTGAVQIIAMSESRTGSSTLTVTPAPVATVSLSSAVTPMIVGGTQVLTALPRDAGGNILSGRTVSWTSSNPAVLTVSAPSSVSSGSGATVTVSAVGTGTATVTATSESAPSVTTPTITVNPVPVASVSVALAPGSITAVGTSQATATTRDANGNPLSGRVVTWSSSNTAVATVDAQGVVSGVAVGTASITATSEGKTGSATVTVTPAPVATISVALGSSSINTVQTTQATATLKDAKGRVLTGRAVAWSSDNTGVATVISSTGVVSPVSAGTANIVATSEGITGSAALTVTTAPVASITVSAPTTPMIVGTTQQLTATTKAANGQILTGRTITWLSSNTAVLTVSATGSTATVTAVGVGTATITATSETVSSSPTPAISVNPVPVATVSVSLASSSINAIQTTQATATLLDAQSHVLTGRTIVWSSDNAAVATVSSTGLVSAVGPGTATIAATSEGKIGSAVLTVTPAPVASVSVTLSPTSITAVGTSQATAVTLDANGNALTGRTVTWTSSNSAVATVNSAGLVTAVSVGTANITATSEGKSGNAPLSVTPAPVATVVVSPGSASVVSGTTRQLTATTSDAKGRTLTGRVITWTSSAPGVATVSASGLVTAVSPGTATITATSEGIDGTSAITVTPVPVASVSVSLATSPIQINQTTQATATLRDGNNNVLSGRTIVWSSDALSVATVSATGVVTAIATGTANITATSEGKSGSAAVTVVPIPVASVAVALNPTSITAVGTSQATATTLDASGQPLTGRPVTWSSADEAVATVSPTGVVTAVAVGTVNIVATSEGKSGSATLTVTAAPVASVNVTLAQGSITAIGSTQATATLLDSKGRTLTGRGVAWTSGNSAVATVSSSGVVTGAGVGTASITATSEGVTGSATLTVTPAPVATVTVTPGTADVIVGSTQQLAAETKDAAGNVLTGRAITWISSDETIATVSATGLVSTLAVGSATITATSEGQSGTSAITVIPVPVATVNVTLSQTTITAVGTSQATAETLDGSGNVLTGRPVTWSSSNTAVATVSTSGLVTAIAVGSTEITAASEGQTGSATLTVTAAPVATVTVTLGQASITAVGTTQATAVLKDAQGRTLTGRSITWSSSNENAATVGTDGFVAAVNAGAADITATSESVTGSATITVTPAPVATVAVTPASAALVVGVIPSQQLTATLKDARGMVLVGRTVTWSSDNIGIAAVSSSGFVTAVAAGTATITATSEGVIGTSAITVTVPTNVASLLHVSSANRRYFENASGQTVYLTGSHTWSNLQDNGTVDPPAAFNYTAYLDFLEEHHHNFFRLWAWEQSKWTAEIAADYWITPGPFARTGPGTALDGKPKFDVTQFNQAYFDRLRSRVQDAGARGIYVAVMLFDGWSVGGKGGLERNNPWRGHPLNGANNVNGIDGDTNGDGFGFESQTLGNSAVTALQDAYVRKVIESVGDLDNVLYEISNESDASSKDWQYHMIQVIRSYEASRPKQHMVGITAMWPGGSDGDLIASDADWVSTGESSLLTPDNANAQKVSILDTDHVCGICGTVDWVWKSFAKGHNPILMDGYDGAAIGLGAADYTESDPKWEAIRKNMGYTRDYAKRMDLSAAVPHGNLVNSETIGYCLAKPGVQYLVYIPSAGSVNLNLSDVSGSLNVEWFNPATGTKTQAGTVGGGASVTLTAPFGGPAVLFLY